MKKKFAGFILRFPKSVIFVTFLFTLILATGARKLRIDDNLKDMLPSNMPSRIALDRIDDIFGGSDTVVIAIGSKQGTIFNPGTLAKVKQLSDALEAMPGIRNVTSLVTLKSVKGTGEGLEVTPFMEEAPTTPEEIKKLKKAFFEDETYVGQIVSKDSRYTAVAGLVDKNADEFKLMDEINALVARFHGPEEIHLAGYPILRATVSRYMKLDIRRLIPFVILVVIAILYLSFRTLRGVVLPLLTVLMSVLSTVGLMGHLNKPFVMINNTLPVILMAIGTAYGIHVVSKYSEETEKGHGRREALETTISDVAIPVIMAGLTTVAGFISLVTTPMPKLVEFGLFAAFGVFLALIFSLTTVPALLALMPVPKKAIKASAEKESLPREGLLSRVLEWLSVRVIRFRIPVLIVGALLALGFSLGIPHVRPEMNPIAFFTKGSEVRKSDATVNSNLGGSVNMSFLVSGDMESPETLKKMEKIQAFLEKEPGVTSTLSMSTIIKKINKALNGDDRRFEKIPDSKEAVSQSILLYSMSGSPEDFERIVDTNYQHGQIIARLKSVSTSEISRISNKAERYLADVEQGKKTTEITGFSVLMKDLAVLVIKGQASSFAVSIILVFLMAWATYRSLKIALLAIIPLTITILVTLGIMGYFGIDLSIPTAVIVNVIIGCGIDYSFHFLSRYMIERKGAGPSSPIARTIQGIGKPILFNSVSVALGFLVLLFSGFLPLQFVGFLIALAMISCGFGSLTLLPAAISFTRDKRDNGRS